MDNNEVDKILKDKLKNSIKPSANMEEKIKQKVETEKEAKLKTIEIKDDKNKKKNKNYKKLISIISIAAVILVVFVAGVGINNNLNKEVTVAKITAIEPTKMESGILANDSEFLISAEGENINKESIQKSIYIEPALDYTIEKVSGDQYKLKFKQNIPDNTIVKLQYIKNKVAEDSWAYQTSNRLSITSTYPASNSSYVEKNSTIEIQFSYGSVENLEKYVTISPKIDGTWEHLGKVWRFTPKSELEETQKYTVTVNKGITAENQTLENEYVFTFTIDSSEENGDPAYTYSTISIDGITTFKPDESVKIYYNHNEYAENQTKISKVEISKFKTIDDFIEYVKTKNPENTESLGEYKFDQKANYLDLNKSLQSGYYVASVQTAKGKEMFNCPIQINDLSAYAIESERDVIVWVAQGENLAKNVKVEYLDKEAKTNNQGIAKFEDIADNSQAIKYLKLGNDDNKLVVGIYNYELNNYPNAYLYTDRPLYKNTDTINIWGFVPRELFYDNIEDDFYIELNDEGKQKVEVGEDGNLNYKIELNNHIDDEYAYITLYYKDTSIGSRSIEIENYELQNYSYEVVADKNYVYSGNKYEFDIKVEHVTGLAVPNKPVAIDYNDKIYKETTNENGIAHFSIKMEVEDDQSTTPSYEELQVYNGDLEEYVGAENWIDVTVLNRNIYAQIEESNKTYKVTLHKLSKDKNAKVDYDLAEIYDGVYNTNVEINLVESVRKRTVSGYIYNEYTKQNEPDYSWEESGTNTKKIKTVKTQDGVFELDASKLEYKKDTKDTEYSYELEFVYKDENGKQVKEKEGVYLGEEYSSTSLGYSWMDWYNSDGYLEYVPSDIDYDSYYSYRYLLKRDKEDFVVGDTVNFTLAESTENGIQDIQNNGKILRVVLQEDITKEDVIENNDLNYTFTDSDFPGCKITSAYFYKGKFYRMPIYYFDFKEEDRKVDIEITADKTEYKPGDEVTITVKTTNKGEPVKSFVNISVANEAVFALQGDETNILETVYTDKTYPIYTYSAYRDTIKAGVDRRRWWQRRTKRRLWRYRIF